MISRVLHEKEGAAIPLIFFMLIVSFRSMDYEASWTLVLLFSVGIPFYWKYFFYKAKTNLIIFGSLIGISIYSYLQCRNGHCWSRAPISIRPFDFLYIVCFIAVGATIWKNYREVLTENKIEIEIDYFGMGWVMAFVFGVFIFVISAY